MNDNIKKNIDKNLKVIFIPYWIKTAINVNKLNIRDILDFTKIKSILSIEDIAEFLFCSSLTGCNNNDTNIVKPQINDFLNSLSISLPLHYLYKDSVSGVNKRFLESIYPLVYTENNIKNIINKLTLLTDVISPEITFHNIVPISDNLIIIEINKGFINALDNKDYMLNFLKSYLKTISDILPQETVTSTTAYKKYISIL